MRTLNRIEWCPMILVPQWIHDLLPDYFIFHNIDEPSLTVFYRLLIL